MELRGCDFRWFPVIPGDFRWFPDCWDVRFTRQNVLLLHMDPPKIGSDPDLARPGPIQARLTHFGLTFGPFFGPFSIRFWTAWALKVPMQVQMTMPMHMQMQTAIGMQMQTAIGMQM